MPRRSTPLPKLPRALARALGGLPKSPVAFVPTMQPELVKQLPAGPNWQYEVKWDGFRALAVKREQEVTLFSRNRTNLTAKYPSAVKQLGDVRCTDAVIDGELVALDEQGKPSFQSLQNYSSRRGTPIAFI